MSTLRPDTIRPPALVRKQGDGEVFTYRHHHSRRIYKVTLDGQTATIATRSGRRRRTIGGQLLASDFVRVVPCSRCGGHHDKRKARHA